MGSDDGIAKVTAHVPLAEMFGYATDIRSKNARSGYFFPWNLAPPIMARGGGVPRNVAEAIISKNQLGTLRKERTRNVKWHAKSFERNKPHVNIGTNWSR